MISIVIDTNVFVSALMSADGASYKLVSMLDSGVFKICLSTAVVIEYESVAKRLLGTKIMLSEQDIDDLIDYLCSIATLQEIFYLWRPTLKDSGDEMILELAANARCSYIITHNVRDFQGIEQFGIAVISPKDFLRQIGA